MNTLQQLNAYSNDPIFFIDKRLLNIVYAQGIPRDRAVNEFLNVVHPLADGAQIVEFEGEGEATFTLTVPTGATVNWSTLPVSIERTIVDNEYTATITSFTEWLQLLAATRVTITTSGAKEFTARLQYIEGKTFLARDYTWTITTTPVAWVNELVDPVDSFYGLRTTFPLLNVPQIGASASEFQNYNFRLEIFSSTLNITGATAPGPAAVVFEGGRLKLSGTREQINTSAANIRITTDTEAIQDYTLSYQLFNVTVGTNGTKVQTLKPSGTAIMVSQGNGFFGTNSTWPLVNPQQVGPRVSEFDDDGYVLEIDSVNLNITNISSVGSGSPGVWDGAASKYTLTGTRDEINSHLNSMLITTATLTSANKSLRYTLTAVASGTPKVTTQTMTVPATAAIVATGVSNWGVNSTWPLVNPAQIAEPVSAFDVGGYQLVIDSTTLTITNVQHNGLLTPGVWDGVARTYTITGSRNEINQHLNQLLITNTGATDTTNKSIRYTLTALMKGFVDSAVTQSMEIPVTADLVGTGNTNWGRASTWPITNPRQVEAPVHPFDAGGYTVTLRIPSLDLSGPLPGGAWPDDDQVLTYTGSRLQINTWLQTQTVTSRANNTDPSNKTLNYTLTCTMSGVTKNFSQTMELPAVVNLVTPTLNTFFGVGTTWPLQNQTVMAAPVGIFDSYGYRVTLDFGSLDVSQVAYVGPALNQFELSTWDPIDQIYTLEGRKVDIDRHLQNLVVTTTTSNDGSNKTLTLTSTNLMKGFPETPVTQTFTLPTTATLTTPVDGWYGAANFTWPMLTLVPSLGVSSTIWDDQGYTLTISSDDITLTDVITVGGGTGTFNSTTRVYTMSGSRSDINARLSNMSLRRSGTISGARSLKYQLTANRVGVPILTTQVMLAAPAATATPLGANTYLPSVSAAGTIEVVPSAALGTTYRVIVQPATASQVLSLGTSETPGVTRTYVASTRQWTLEGPLTNLNDCLLTLQITRATNVVAPITLNFNIRNTYGVTTSTQTRTMTFDTLLNQGVTNATVARDFTEATLVNLLFDNSPLPSLNFTGENSATQYELRVSIGDPVFYAGEIHVGSDVGWDTVNNRLVRTGTKDQINALLSTIQFRPKKDPFVGSTSTLNFTVLESGVVRADFTATLTKNARTAPFANVGVYTYTTGETNTLSVAADTLKYANVTVKLVARGGDSRLETSEIIFAGGGGAGGFIETTAINNAISSATLNAGNPVTLNVAIASNGDTVLSTTSPSTTELFRALRGGDGGSSTAPATPGPGNGVAGGSGGGAANTGSGSTRTGGAGTAGQGFAGGDYTASTITPNRGGGGGGCTEPGQSRVQGGNGGAGVRRTIAGVEDCWISWGGAGYMGDGLLVSDGSGKPAYGMGGRSQNKTSSGAPDPATANNRFGTAGVAEIEITAP